MEQRKVERFVNGIWNQIQFQELKKGDHFRMFEPEGNPVKTPSGEAYFEATTDPYIWLDVWTIGYKFFAYGVGISGSMNACPPEKMEELKVGDKVIWFYNKYTYFYKKYFTREELFCFSDQFERMKNNIIVGTVLDVKGTDVKVNFDAGTDGFEGTTFRNFLIKV